MQRTLRVKTYLATLGWAPLLLVLVGASATASPRSISRMFEFLGGSESIARVRSLAVEAECEGPTGPFRTHIESRRPDAVYFDQSHGDRRTEIWSSSSGTWARRNSGRIEAATERESYFAHSHEFHLLLFEIDRRFHDFKSGDAAEVNGEACDLVRMSDSSGQPATICIARRDGRPVVLELHPAGAAGTVRITFRDWRVIDGLRYFGSFEMTEGPERRFRYRYVEIQPNATIRTVFDLADDTEDAP